MKIESIRRRRRRNLSSFRSILFPTRTIGILVTALVSRIFCRIFCTISKLNEKTRASFENEMRVRKQNFVKPLSIINRINKNISITIIDIIMIQCVLIESSIINDNQIVLFTGKNMLKLKIWKEKKENRSIDFNWRRSMIETCFYIWIVFVMKLFINKMMS